MPEMTIAIDRRQREGLYELVRNHLGLPVEISHHRWHPTVAIAGLGNPELGVDVRGVTRRGLFGDPEASGYRRVRAPLRHLDQPPTGDARLRAPRDHPSAAGQPYVPTTTGLMIVLAFEDRAQVGDEDL